MPSRNEIVMPAGVVDPRGVVSEADILGADRALVINESGLPDQQVEEAARTYFMEQASVGGLGRAPSTFATHSANQGSMLARTEYQTPTNIIEEIKLSRELAERDDDIGSVIGTMVALAFGDGMENFHEDEQTLAIYNTIAKESNLDRALREMYREYLISHQVNLVTLFTRTSLDYKVKKKQNSDLIAWPYLGVVPAENIRVLDNDMFGTGTLAYDASDDPKLRAWLEEYFNPETSPAKKAELGRRDRVAANMFTEEVQVDAMDYTSDLYTVTGKLYKLNPRIVHRMTGPKGNWKYPRPLLTRNFALLEAKRLLNLMDYSLLQGGANYIVIAKKGSDTLPATGPELTSLTEVVRRSSRTGVIVGDHRLTFEVITPDLKELLNPDKRKLVGRKLARGLLRLPEMEEAGGTDAAKLDGELIPRIIASDRHEIKRFVERTAYTEIQKRNQRLVESIAKLWFPMIVLQGAQYFTDYVLKLRDRGDIPREWGVEAAGFNYDAGVQVRKRELERGDDDILMPGAVPHSSPQAGPQDNNQGRPKGAQDGRPTNDPARPKRKIGQNRGETITAREDEGLDFPVRIGDVTYAILDEFAEEYRTGRVTQTDREMLGAEGAQQAGTNLYVPVNSEYEIENAQAVRLSEDIRMIIGDKLGSNLGAKVAKLIVFRDTGYTAEQAELRVMGWGFGVDQVEPEPDEETPDDRSDFSHLIEVLADQAPPVVNVEIVNAQDGPKRLIRDAEGNIVGSEPVPTGGE